MSSHRYSTRSSGTRRGAPPAVVSVGQSGGDSSDEFEFADTAEASSHSVNSTISVSSTASKQRDRLPLNTQKTVLQDIEGTGGIQTFDVGKRQALSKLLDNPSHREIFGERGSDTRKKITKWVTRLKILPRPSYLEKCKALGVFPAEETFTSDRKSASKSASKTPSKNQLSSLASPPSAHTAFTAISPPSEIRPISLSFTQYREPAPLIPPRTTKSTMSNTTTGEYLSCSTLLT